MATYTIKEISKMFNIPSSTIRYYEDMGLLPPVGRTSSNQRIFDDSHINRLNAIECFKNTGLTISKMQDFFRYEQDLTCHIDQIIQLVTDHEAAIKEQLIKMEQDLEHISKKVRYYNGIKKAMEENQPWPCWDHI